MPLQMIGTDFSVDYQSRLSCGSSKTRKAPQKELRAKVIDNFRGRSKSVMTALPPQPRQSVRIEPRHYTESCLGKNSASSKKSVGFSAPHFYDESSGIGKDDGGDTARTFESCEPNSTKMPFKNCLQNPRFSIQSCLKVKMKDKLINIQVNGPEQV